MVLHIDRLTKRFVLHERGKIVEAQLQASFDAWAGKLAAVVGPSGVGKSTLLKCVYRTYRPTGGFLLYRKANNEILDLGALDDRRVLELRRTEIALVTQFLYCLPRKPAIDVVAQPLVQGARSGRSGDGRSRPSWAACSRSEARERAAVVLRRVGLREELWDLPPATFSGGERQRVNIARGVVAAPRLLLLDEPTASLDPPSRERVAELVVQAKRAGTAVVAASHDEWFVRELSDSIVRVGETTAETADAKER
jgi:alpha-D-ribose 1-methylphosphonate 5-triphosphate synthase subunit PhnL